MQRDVQEKLILQLKRYIDTSETTMVDSERLNPASEYWDPARWAQERSELFPQHPIVVGHASEIPDAGSHFVDELSGTPILIMRLPSGRLWGLVPDGESRTMSLSSDEIGELASTRSAEHQTAPAGFRTVEVEERHGLIWVLLGAREPIDVAGFLGAELDDELTSFALGDYALERTHFFTAEKLNWKSVIDGFLENYHVRYLHGETLAKFLRSNVHVYDAFGPHARLAVIKTTFDRVKDLPVNEYDPLKHMSIVYQIFPNTIIGWVGDHFETWTSFPDPVSVSRSNTRFTMLTPVSRTWDHKFWDRSMKTVLDVIPTEDFEMSRRMQRGLPAEAQTHQVFGRNEGALQHFHIELEKVLGPAQ
ncbi:MAG: hypothetical protein EOP24_29455 [Hyphomicrobiales bacterium]|nr:MAG: hypothetical protein EOP24_29455 [Hyphomicrobiales bacterium]